MKKGLLLLCLMIPGNALAQTTLNFPRFFSVDELRDTGFAVVNPGDTDATATYTLRGISGLTVAQATHTIPAGGQLARLGTGSGEVFSSVSGGGWLQVTSPTTGLQGFWVGGDFATFADGATAAPVSSDLVLPFVTSNTEINLVNTSSTPATLLLSLRDGDGLQLAASTQVIVNNGVFQAQAAALFPGADLSRARHILVTGGFAISGTVVVGDFEVSPSRAVVSGVPLSSTATTLNFPHVVTGAGGGGNWLTTIGVTNLSASGNQVSITFNPLSGNPTTVQRSLIGRGSVRESLQQLFGFNGYREGWIQVTSARPVAGFVAYADTTAGGVAVVPAQVESLESMMFAHLAQATGWLTGVALLNTTGTAANVEVFAMNPDGSLIGGARNAPTAAFTLAPGTKVARLINEWIPTATTNGGFVFVRTTNGVPLFGIELFFLENLQLLANVSAVGLAPGITYTPPPPGGGLTLTSISPAIAARGSTVTLGGSGFRSSQVVVFSTGGGTVSVQPGSVSNTSMTATVPSTAISGPVFVDAGDTSSESRILQVVRSDASQIQNPVSVSAGGTTSDVDIYVPVPQGNLNLEGIGKGERSEGISASASSVTLSRGETTDLLIVGDGISSANGSTLSITGGGITLSDVAFGSSSMFVQIDVSTTAATGPRAVTMTNSNADTSILAGGIIID